MNICIFTLRSILKLISINTDVIAKLFFKFKNSEFREEKNLIYTKFTSYVYDVRWFGKIRDVEQIAAAESKHLTTPVIQ